MDALATMEPASMQQAMSLAATLAKSGLIPRALQNKPGDVLVVLLTGRELGLGPMQSLRTIHVVDGKAVLSADLIIALCVRQRSVCRYFRLVRSTDDVAEYETLREGSPEPTRLAFTKAQAQQAGVLGKQNWRNWPAAMMRARCGAALARAVYPDLAAGLYDPDELDHPAAMQPPTEAEVVPLRPEATPSPALPAQRGPVVDAFLDQKAADEHAERAGHSAAVVESGRIEHRTEVERVRKALGGEVESVKVEGVVLVGQHKDKKAEVLSDQQLTAEVALFEERIGAGDVKAALAKGKRPKWLDDAEATLAVLRAEVERRIHGAQREYDARLDSMLAEPGAAG